MHPIRELIHHDTDIYRGFDSECMLWKAVPSAKQDWGGDHLIFAKLVQQYRPKLIIEVGTWKGQSAITMAQTAELLGLNTHVLCIDTWLGNVTTWTCPGRDKAYESLQMQCGYPSIYYEFLSNVVRAGMQDRITPFPATSEQAACFLRHKQVHAELIYIDGSHEFSDVSRDLRDYWKRLAIGGHLFGHDYHMPPVGNAVREFAKEKDVLVNPESHEFWRLLQ